MQYRDSHAHLLDCSDADSSITLARKAGIKQIFCNTTSAKQWQACLDLSIEFPEVEPFLGLHPWFVTPESLDDLTQLPTLLDATAAGIGEIGLDKRCSVNFSLQEYAFTKQLEIASNKQIFFSIHCVQAWGLLLDTLATFADKTKLHFMIHGFNGSRETMERLVSLGGLISFSCKIAEPSQEKLRQVFLATPLKHVLLETDTPNQYSPALAAQSTLSGMDNTPGMVKDLYQYCAHIRKMNLTTFTKQIWQNGTIFPN